MKTPNFAPIRRFVAKEWLSCLTSLFLAVLLWYNVGGEQTVDTNVMIPVEVINLPRELVISNQFKKDIEVSVNGPRSVIMELQNQQITRQIDLSQATPGADENTGKDMGLVLQAARSIAAALEGLVILVHHSGKDGSKGLRGHSSLNAAMDAVICVERDRLTGIRSWRVTKMKDAEDGATGKFVLDRVDLGPDGYGGRTTSAALKESSGAEAVFAKVQSGPRGVHQQVVLDALRGLPDQASGWGMAELIGVAKAALSDVGSRYRAARARSALDGLLAAGFISVDEGGRYTLTS